VKAVRPRGRPATENSERSCRNDCETWQLCKEDAMRQSEMEKN